MTKHQIDPRQFDDSDLSRHLLAARGTQWMRGNRGDPYALILRDQGIEPRVLGILHQGMRGRPLLRQSESDVWVTASHEAGAAILADERLVPEVPAGAGRARRQRIFGIDSRTSLKHVLAVDDPLLAMDRAGFERLGALTDPVLGAAPMADRHDAAAGAFAESLGRAGGSAFDLMTDVARTASASFFAELLKLPEDLREVFEESVAVTAAVPDALLCPPTLSMARRLVASYDMLRGMLEELIAARAAAPGDDLVSALLRATSGGGAPAEDTLAALMLTLGLGVGMASNLVCAAVCALLEHPDQWALLHENPSLAAAAVEETLRFAPPVRLVSRIASTDVEIAGQPVEHGHQLVVLVDAANRDPEVYDEPERFRITGRSAAAAHLSLDDASYAGFVGGSVRLLTRAALEVLVSGPYRGLRPDGEPVHRMRAPVTHGVARFPVAVA
ncbi:cytochrome P450 family protein [Streptomyces umbrinus]